MENVKQLFIDSLNPRWGGPYIILAFCLCDSYGLWLLKRIRGESRNHCKFIFIFCSFLGAALMASPLHPKKRKNGYNCLGYTICIIKATKPCNSPVGVGCKGKELFLTLILKDDPFCQAFADRPLEHRG